MTNGIERRRYVQSDELLCTDILLKQEAKLMLTNPRDAFRGNQGHQTWYHSMLGMVSY